MYSPETLIAAYADEDRRLQEVVRQYPVAKRGDALRREGLSLIQTLGHLAFWDVYAVRFYEARIEDRAVPPLTFAEFESRNRHELQRLYGLPFEQVREAYLAATRDLLAFLHRHWDDLDEQERTNFTIPLKHRRHHRHLLQEHLQALPLAETAAAAAERAG